MNRQLRASCALSALTAALAASISAAPALAQDEDRNPVSDGIDTIIVSASPLDTTQDDLLIGASVLSGEDLIRNAQATIGETLRKEPGVSSTAFGAGASRPIIRGLGGDRVRVLTNGIGSIDASAASPDHAVAVEPATAERIEVVRGTSLLRFGSSAAGGVVNVLDGRMPSVVPENGIEGALRATHTTVDDGGELAGGVTAHVGKIGGLDVVFNAQGSWRDAEDYDIPGFAESELLRRLEAEEHEGEEHGAEHEGEEHGPHEEEEEVFGTLENAFVETTSGSAGLSFIGERGFLAFSVQQTNSTYGVPGHAHAHGHGEDEHGDEDHGEEEEHGHEEEHGEEEEGVFIELDQIRYDVNGRIELGGPFQALDVYAGIADYEHIEFEGPLERGTVFANQGYEIRTELLQTERNGWRGATGFQVREREFSAIGEEAFVPPTETEQLGVYTFQGLHRGAWHAEAALRLETTEHVRSEDAATRDFDSVSASLGTGYDISPNLSVSATAFRTERAPTTEELFSNGPHLATRQFELGDQSLGIETALGLEGIVHLHGERGNLTLNVFYTDYEDFIYQRELGIFGDEYLASIGVTDEEELEEFGELPVFQFTAADARFAGFEIFGETLLAETRGFAITADGVLDYVDAELTNVAAGESTNLPRIPPLSLTAGLEADGYGANFRVELEHTAEVDEGDTADFELPTESYTLLNLYASYALTENVMVRAAALNVTDEEARVHTSFLKDDLPLPGRNFRISVGYQF